MVGSELDTGGTKERCSGLEYDEPPYGNHPPCSQGVQGTVQRRKKNIGNRTAPGTDMIVFSLDSCPVCLLL